MDIFGAITPYALLILGALLSFVGFYFKTVNTKLNTLTTQIAVIDERTIQQSKQINNIERGVTK